MKGGATLTAARAEVKRIDRELDTLLNLILKGGHAERIQREDGSARLARPSWSAHSPTRRSLRRCFIPRWRPSTVSR